MKKKVIYSLIMDRSSSMWEIRDEILKSVNDRIKTIKALDIEDVYEILTDLTLFNHKVSRVLSLLMREDLKLLTPEEYQVNGTTALYDAIGSTLERLYCNLKEDIENSICKVIVVVYTDGYENASRMYSREDIKSMIDRANKIKGVEISIVGCDEETLTMADSMNFKKSNVVRVSKESIARSMYDMDQYFDDFINDKNTKFKDAFKKYDLD